MLVHDIPADAEVPILLLESSRSFDRAEGQQRRSFVKELATNRCRIP